MIFLRMSERNFGKSQENDQKGKLLDSESQAGEASEKLEQTSDAAEIVMMLQQLGEQEIEKSLGRQSGAGFELSLRLKTLAKDFAGLNLTEAQKELLMGTIEQLQSRIAFQQRHSDKPETIFERAAKEYDGDPRLEDDINLAAIQLYTYLHTIKTR